MKLKPIAAKDFEMTKFSLAEVQDLRILVARIVSGDRSAWQDGIDELYCAIAYSIPSFDWNNWNKGLQGLKNAGGSVFAENEIYDEQVTSDSFSEFDQKELLQLLLMIHRVNRFSDGYYDKLMENRVVLKILDRLIVEMS